MFVFVMLTLQITSQENATLKGVLLDGEMNNEPLSFANVFIKGTSKGTTTEIDGTYILKVEEGSHVLVFSFLGYASLEVPVVVKWGETLTINKTLKAAEGVTLEEVKVKAATSKEKESALLLEQKKATVIKESIGAARLSQTGVSNAATATTKISGVTQSEGSGDIYIRGLGDRYLSTTMNGLPIPSDDVQNKNIDLGLFGTGVLNSIGISKTYATSGYSDQASGNVDISSKRHSKNGFTLNLGSGFNTAVLGLDRDFKTSVASGEADFGFHKKKYLLSDAIKYQTWDPLVKNNITNYSFGLSAATKLVIFDKDLSIFLIGSHGKSFEYREGFFKSFRANVLDNDFTTERYKSSINTTGYIRGDLKVNQNHKLSYNTLFVNKAVDNVYEQGRDGLGYVFDQQPFEDGAFVRDQNFKQTTFFVNQLMGEHQLSERNNLTWAGGYNFVLAEEPNRIRNEGNFYPDGSVTFAYVGDFQQRKSGQKIEDVEYNGRIQDQFTFGTPDEDDERGYKLNIGANYRYKERIFRSQFIGVSARNFIASSMDNLSPIFMNRENYEQPSHRPELIVRNQNPDRYEADLTYMAGFTSLDFGLNSKFSGNIGARFEKNEIYVLWDVGNYVGRIGSVTKNFSGVYPSINLKYELNDRNAIRIATSLTQTLPEFKEIAPFEYVSPTGRVTKGNPDLDRSQVINVDVKWEFFPSREQLVSVTGFYKNIKDPINLAQARGSAGIFEFHNTGDRASVLGFEVEGRVSLLKNEDDEALLKASANVTQMWFEQDLLENFQYFGRTKADLQGASNTIVNGSLNYNNREENPFIATISGNYASDKIFALGSPEDFVNSTTLFNDEIIEKGFVTLDLVISKELLKGLSIKLTGRNLLNPEIKQTQLITVFDQNDAIVGQTNETVQSYKRGSQITFGFTYKF